MKKKKKKGEVRIYRGAKIKEIREKLVYRGRKSSLIYLC
jgi:hypothetical protein